MRRFEFRDHTSEKYWEVTRTGGDLTTRWGRIGTSGQSKTKVFESEAKAQRARDDLVKEKLGKGYVEVVSTPGASIEVDRSRASGRASESVANRSTVTAPSVSSAPSASTASSAVELDDAVDVAWSEELRARTYPRRSRRPAPVVCDAVALETVLGPAKAFLGTNVINPPVAFGVAEGAATYLTLPPQVVGLRAAFIDYLVATKGAIRALEVLLASLELEQAHGPSDRRLGGAFLQGWIRLRAYFAGAPDAIYEAALSFARARLPSVDVSKAAALAFVFPDDSVLFGHAVSRLGEIAKGMIRATLAGLLATCVTSAADLDALVRRNESVHTFPARVHHGEPSTMEDFALTILDGVGPDAAPSLARLIPIAYGNADKKALASVIARIPTESALLALLDGVPAKQLAAVVGGFFGRAPRLSLRALARCIGTSRDASARPLFAALARKHPELTEALIPELSEPARRIAIDSCVRARPDGDEASPERLPAVLVAPPWTKPGASKKQAPIALPSVPFEESIVWEPGQRDAWRSRYWQREMLAALEPAARRAKVLSLAELSKHRHCVWEAATVDEAKAALAGYSPFGSYLDVDVLSEFPEPAALALWELTPWDAYIAVPTGFTFVARYELAVLDGLLKLTGYAPSLAVPLLAPYRAPRIALPMAVTYAKKKALRPAARAWLVAHAECAAFGLLPIAFGARGAARDHALAGLHSLVAFGCAEHVAAGAARYGDAGMAALEIALAGGPLARIPKKMPVLPDFFDVAVLSAPRLRGGMDRLPAASVTHLGSMLAISTIAEPYAGLEIVKEACDPDSLARFAWDLFEAWMRAGAPGKESWAFTALAFFQDEDCVRRLVPYIRRWPGESAAQRAIVGLDILAAHGGDAALTGIHGIAEKIQFKSLQTAARAKIAEIAASRGLTEDELGDRLVPDLGLDASGTTTLDFGTRAFTVGFDEQLRPFARDAAGRPIGELPRPNKNDDSAKAALAVERWKALKKDAKSITAMQVRRFEKMLTSQRRIEGSAFEALVVRHPLLRHFATRLVWGAYREDGSLVATFRATGDGTFADEADQRFVLDAAARVGLPHPIDLPAATLTRWSRLLDEYGILQPLAQLGREVHRLPEASAHESNFADVAGRTIATGTLYGLDARGWMRGSPLDAGMVHEFAKAVPGTDLEIVLEIEPGIYAGDASEFPEQRLVRALVSRRSSIAGAGPVPLARLDPLTYSEAVRDLSMLHA